jgi:hypothetical protein
LERNAPARAFYERLGGIIAAQRDEDFAGTKLVELGIVWPSPADLVQRTLPTA